MTNGISSSSPPSPPPAAGKIAGAQMLAAEQKRLLAAEDVKNPDDGSQTIGIENLLTTMMVKRAQDINDFLGGQAENLNMMNSKVNALQSVTPALAEKVKDLGLYFQYIQTDPQGRQASDFFYNYYQGDTNPNKYQNNAGCDYIVPRNVADAIKNLLGGTMNPQGTVTVAGAVECPIAPGDRGYNANIPQNYIDPRYLGDIDNAIYSVSGKVQSLLTTAGIETETNWTMIPQAAGLVAKAKAAIPILNQDAQTQIQNMNKTMNYATQYEQMASMMITNSGQEVTDSINHLNL